MKARIAGIQKHLEHINSSRLLLLEKRLQVEYSQTLRQEEMLFFQKSREKWIKLGDGNTAFFHTQTVVRGRRSKVERVFIDEGI